MQEGTASSTATANPTARAATGAVLEVSPGTTDLSFDRCCEAMLCSEMPE